MKRSGIGRVVIAMDVCMCASVCSIVRIKMLALFTLAELLLLTVFHRDDALEIIRSTLHNDTHGCEAAAAIRSTSLMLAQACAHIRKVNSKRRFSMNRAFVWSIDQHTNALHSSY